MDALLPAGRERLRRLVIDAYTHTYETPTGIARLKTAKRLGLDWATAQAVVRFAADHVYRDGTPDGLWLELTQEAVDAGHLVRTGAGGIEWRGDALLRHHAAARS